MTKKNTGTTQESREEIAAAKAESRETMRRVIDGTTCIVLSFSRFNTRRSVDRDDAKVVATAAEERDAVDQKMTHVSKEARAVESYDSVTARHLAELSVPMTNESLLFRSGVRLFGVDTVLEVVEYLKERKAGRVKLVDALKAAYPELVRASRERLGPLFKASQYPAQSVIEREFDMEWMIVDWYTPNKKLKLIDRALFEQQKEKAKEIWTDAVKEIGSALVAGLSEQVAFLSDRLGEGKKVRKEAVDRVNEFLDAFGKRNVVERQDLAKLADQAKKLLAGVDAKQLRDDEAVRARVADGFSAIKKELSGLMEAAPSRPTIADEENA